MSNEEIKKMFTQYGEISTVFIKHTDPNILDKLPEVKRNHILNHQFAFITYKDPQSSMKVVDELPYLKQNNKTFNEELKTIVEAAKRTKDIEDRHLYRLAAYIMDEHEKEWATIIGDKTQFTEKIEAFKKV